MKEVGQFLALLSVGISFIVAIVFLAKEHIGWILIGFLALGAVFAVFMYRKKRPAEVIEEKQDEQTRFARNVVRAFREPPETRTAPPETVSKGEVSVPTTVTTTTSNHPMAGHTGAFMAIVSFILDIMTAAALFYFLAGWVKVPDQALVILGLSYPPELLIPFIAYGYYWLTSLFSVRRERSPRWAKVDAAGAVIIGLVLAGALASFNPMVADLYKSVGLPVVAYTVINVVTILSFGLAVATYIYWYHIRRAEVGLEGIQSTRVYTTRPMTAEQAIGEAIANGRGVEFPGATITIQNMVVADSDTASRIRVKPRAVDEPRRSEAG